MTQTPFRNVIQTTCLSLLLIMSIIVYKTDGWSHIRAKIIGPPPAMELPQSFYQTVASHLRIDQNLPDKSILFIGDSHVQGLAVTAVAPLGVNFGIGKDTTLGVLHRLPLYTSRQKAQAIVLAIGYNDLKIRDNDAIVKNIALILEEIPANVPVLLCGVMPVDEMPKNLTGFNVRIARLNQQLSGLANSRAETTFLNPIPILSDETGALPTSLHSGDGIHLNSQGYSRWIGALVNGLEKQGF